MRTAIQVLCLLALVGTVSRAETTVKDYRNTMSSEDQAQIALTRLYVNGIAAGIMAANARLDAVNQLYCAPKSLVLNTDNYLDILDREIAILSQRGMPTALLDDLPISLAILGGLQENFPCHNK